MTNEEMLDGIERADGIAARLGAVASALDVDPTDVEATRAALFESGGIITLAPAEPADGLSIVEHGRRIYDGVARAHRTDDEMTWLAGWQWVALVAYVESLKAPRIDSAVLDRVRHQLAFAKGKLAIPIDVADVKALLAAVGGES